MGKMSLEELRALRDKKRLELNRRKVDEKAVEIIIGMGTSGIAAGAKAVMHTFIEEVNNHKMENVVIRQAGSIGLDFAEPVIEIRMPEMPNTIYGDVTPELVSEIIEKHIIHKELVDNHVQHRPAPDMIEE
jgi:NADP-reducing hydrogenase subunit HndB